MSNARAGYGNRLEASTPIMAGTPRSSANCTWASCESLGANDIVSTSLDNRYAPKLATYASLETEISMNVKSSSLILS